MERNRANASYYVRMSKMHLGFDRPAINPFFVEERAHSFKFTGLMEAVAYNLMGIKALSYPHP